MKRGPPITFEVAKELCEAYRAEHGVKVFSQCWGCVKFSRGEPGKMCFANLEDNRGCPKVNRIFDERRPQT